MNIIEQIKIKTKQIALKTDKFIREDGMTIGLSVTVGSIIAGALSATTIGILSNPKDIADTLYSVNNSSILGLKLTASSLTMFLGSGIGFMFSTLSEAYKKARNLDPHYDKLNGLGLISLINHKNEKIDISAIKFYEMIESGELKKYKFIETIDNRYSTDINLEQGSKIQLEPDVEKIRRILFINAKNSEFAFKISQNIKNVKKNYYLNTEELEPIKLRI